VVCDAGPILHLREANALNLLARAGEVIVPPAVDRELRTLMADWSTGRPSWVRIARLSEEGARQAEQLRTITDLGLGEAEAIALARWLPADWLLTDDAAARLVASLLGLEVHGSLGVILWAAASGHLGRDEALSVLDRLARSSLWISPRIVDEARRALERLSG
jgi:predicted nucleic acid-binding protein